MSTKKHLDEVLTKLDESRKILLEKIINPPITSQKFEEIEEHITALMKRIGVIYHDLPETDTEKAIRGRCEARELSRELLFNLAMIDPNRELHIKAQKMVSKWNTEEAIGNAK